MRKLIEKIRELEEKSAELEPSETVRNEYLDKVRDFTNSFIEGLTSVKGFSAGKVNREALKLNMRKNTVDSLLKAYGEEVAGKGINAASGGHVGYVPGGGICTAALGDYLADITNEYAGLFFAAPGAVIIEDEVLGWLKTIFGFPGDSAGNLTSGGSIANMIALTAARDHHRIKGAMVEKSVVYLSCHTHHCVHKALKIIGLEDVIMRNVDLDQNWKIEPSRLNDMINDDKAAGLNPFLIVASAGTTDTGAVDPLDDIASIAQTHSLWFHIDAAYGGFFILTESRKDLFRGIEKADSLVADPHKSLFIPYGTGAVLVKNKAAVKYSHQYTANYMQDSKKVDVEIDNPADVSPELTKHFRAMRIWLPLQIHGIEPFIACLEEKLLLARYFRSRLEENGFKTGPEPDLSISYFWYPAGNVDQDTYNKNLIGLIHSDGSVFLTSSIIGGRFVIRMAIVCFRTKLWTIDRAIEMIEKARMRLKEEYGWI
jgi:glutamate/tyrosine decarboxylase-like PLP-dependent enzyme